MIIRNEVNASAKYFLNPITPTETTYFSRLLF